MIITMDTSRPVRFPKWLKDELGRRFMAMRKYAPKGWKASGSFKKVTAKQAYELGLGKPHNPARR